MTCTNKELGNVTGVYIGGPDIILKHPHVVQAISSEEKCRREITAAVAEKPTELVDRTISTTDAKRAGQRDVSQVSSQAGHSSVVVASHSADGAKGEQGAIAEAEGEYPDLVDQKTLFTTRLVKAIDSAHCLLHYPQKGRLQCMQQRQDHCQAPRAQRASQRSQGLGGSRNCGPRSLQQLAGA